MNKIKDIARIKKESKSEDLLTRIKNLERTDRKGFKAILDELGITYTTLGNFLGITGGGVSVWVTAKSMDGISRSQYEDVKRFIEGYYYLKRGEEVRPVSSEDDNNGEGNGARKSAYADFLEFVRKNDISRDAVKAAAAGDYEKLCQFYEDKLDRINERAEEHYSYLQRMGYKVWFCEERGAG